MDQKRAFLRELDVVMNNHYCARTKKDIVY
jgi:hypothetical protein